MSHRLHHVQLAIPAERQDSCRSFYTEVLGLTEIPKPPALAGRGGFWVSADELELHIGIDPDFHPASKAHPGILLDGPTMDALAARLTESGVDVRWDSALPGYRRFHTDDPAGNRLEFLTPARPADQ